MKSRDEVQQDLKDLNPIIALAIERADEDWSAVPRNHVFSPIARASARHEYTTDRVRELCVGIPGVVPHRDSHYLFTVTVSASATYVIRFNQLDPLFRPNLNDTWQTEAFVNQPVLDGMGERIHLVAGPRMDATGLMIRDIWITCPMGPDRFHFQYEIRSSGFGRLPLPLPNPNRPQPIPLDQAAHVKVPRARRSRKE